ncbi:MAG: hypothetical protein KDB61_05515, partial [Planctomycetes bacterium]|nr:hypothetical protein [Planctomycetota bacterium]
STSYLLIFEGGTADPSTWNVGIEAVDSNGNPLPHSVTAAADGVLVHGPATGWPVGSSIRLNSALRDNSGKPLTGAVVLPMQVTP